MLNSFTICINNYNNNKNIWSGHFIQCVSIENQTEKRTWILNNNKQKWPTNNIVNPKTEKKIRKIGSFVSSSISKQTARNVEKCECAMMCEYIFTTKSVCTLWWYGNFWIGFFSSLLLLIWAQRTYKADVDACMVHKQNTFFNTVYGSETKSNIISFSRCVLCAVYVQQQILLQKP